LGAFLVTYVEQLRDPRWQRKRLEIMQRDGFACQECLDDKSTLNVHHKVYRRGFKAWEYDPEHLVTLCEGCHKSITAAGDRMAEALALLNHCDFDFVIGFVRMYAAQWANPGDSASGTIVVHSAHEALGALAADVAFDQRALLAGAGIDRNEWSENFVAIELPVRLRCADHRDAGTEEVEDAWLT
jgi:hypothetical protein